MQRVIRDPHVSLGDAVLACAMHDIFVGRRIDADSGRAFLLGGGINTYSLAFWCRVAERSADQVSQRVARRSNAEWRAWWREQQGNRIASRGRRDGRTRT